MFRLFNKKPEADERKNTPWRYITARAYDEDGRVFFMASELGEYHLGALWVGSPLLGADAGTVEKLRSTLSIPLPAGSFIQIAMLSDPSIEWATDAYLRNKHDTNNPVLKEYSKRRAAFILHGKDEPLIKQSGVLLNNQRLIVTVKIPCGSPPNEEELAEASELADKLQESMKAAGINLDRQDHVGYLVLMRNIAHLYEKKDIEYDEDRPLREQIFFPGDNVEVNKTSLTFHDQYHAKFMSVKHYPKKASLSIMNYMVGDPGGLVNQLTDPFMLTMTIRYPDQTKKASEVTKKAMFIKHQMFGGTAHLIPSLKYKNDGFTTLIEEMEGNGAVLCEMNLTLALFSRDIKKLNRLTAGMQTYFAAIGVEMREDKRVLRALWNLMLPLNTTDNGIKGLFRFQTKAVSHAVQFLPVIGEWQGTGTSATSIMVSPRGHPVLFGLYDSPTNYNFNLIAESGAGKSFATQSFIADFLAEGARVWVIDKGYSYKKLCAAVGGEYIQFSDESGLCLNPFTHITVIDDEMDLLKAMLSKMAAPKDGIDDYQMSILAQAIKGVWAHYGNQSSITAVADWCLSQKDRRAQDIGTQLFEFTRHGSYGHWFDGDNNLQFHKRFVVLELEELSARSHLQQVVLLQLISKVNQEMYLAQLNEKGRKKLLIVDEAKDLIDDPVMSKALESAGSRVRKYEGALGIVTQSIANLYRSPSGRVIAENSAFNIVMMQKSESIDAAIAEKHFKIDAYGEWRLRALHTVPGRYAEMMIKRGDDYGVVRLVTDRFSQVLFSSKGAERNEILDAIDRGEDVVKVIDQFIQERG